MARAMMYLSRRFKLRSDVDHRLAAKLQFFDNPCERQFSRQRDVGQVGDFELMRE